MLAAAGGDQGDRGGDRGGVLGGPGANVAPVIRSGRSQSLTRSGLRRAGWHGRGPMADGELALFVSFSVEITNTESAWAARGVARLATRRISPRRRSTGGKPDLRSGSSNERGPAQTETSCLLGGFGCAYRPDGIVVAPRPACPDVHAPEGGMHRPGHSSAVVRGHRGWRRAHTTTILVEVIVAKRFPQRNVPSPQSMVD